jgi:hypothetical protein
MRENGIIEILVIGDQTVESVQLLGHEAFKLGQQRLKAKKPVLLLDNVSRIGQVPPEARKVVVDLIKANDYDRLAMYGQGPVIKLGANLLLQATGRGKRVRYFDDYDAATAWLLA